MTITHDQKSQRATAVPPRLSCTIAQIGTGLSRATGEAPAQGVVGIEARRAIIDQHLRCS